MGNDTSSLLKVGNVYQSRRAIINDCNRYSHGKGKQNWIIYNQPHNLKIVCAKQGRENRTIDENYSAALKEHKAKGGLKSTFPKKEYLSVCTAIVIAKPHKL